MRTAPVVITVLAAAALALAGCNERPATPRNDTAVLGGSGPGPARGEAAPVVDAQGRPIPAPPAPAGVQPQLARSGPETALAVWVQDGRVVAASFSRASGWSPPQPLEEIYGQASDPQLAANDRGSAMALWRHTVGSIQALRFSRFEAGGWSQPDVLPGALPRAHVEGAAKDSDAPQLRMDTDGSVAAQWPSGFAADEAQSALFVPGQGWSRPVTSTVASAPSGSPAPPAPSSAR